MERELKENLEGGKKMNYDSKELKNRHFAFKIKDRTRFEMDYTKYINDISLKGEFIKLVNEDSSLSEEEKAEIIRTGIMALAGETV